MTLKTGFLDTVCDYLIVLRFVSFQQPQSGGSGSGSADDVIELNDNNFEREVFTSKDLWLVEFFAPW